MLLGPILGGLGTLCTYKLCTCLVSSKEALDFVAWKSQGFSQGLSQVHSQGPFLARWQALSSQPPSVLVSNASSSHAPGQYLCPGGNYSPSEKQPRIIYLHDSCGGSVGDLNNLPLQQLQMNHQKPFCVPVFSSTQKVSSPQAIGWIPYPS